MFKSKKSDKPALDHSKVQRILGGGGGWFVECKYGDTWNIKTLTAKLNQKCCDSVQKKIDLSSCSIDLLLYLMKK